MMSVSRTSQFKKDVKRLLRSGTGHADKLKPVIGRLANGLPLEPRHKPHPLRNEWADHMECHAAPDLLLIYKVDDAKGELTLVRAGSHSELFG